LFFLAEFMNTITMSGVIVTLFFGGPQPLPIGDYENVLSFLGPLSGTVWLLLKVLVFLYIYVWFRATLPRLRYDQLMNLGWKLMIPLALGWFMLLAAFRIGKDEGWDRWVILAGGVGVLAVGSSLLQRATKVSARNREREGAMF
jgi:NADH-quinone oxidoreductase subunit H